MAARGASFTRASCPKSSPSCSVVTSPCSQVSVTAQPGPPNTHQNTCVVGEPQDRRRAGRLATLGLLKALPMRTWTREATAARGLGRQEELTLPWVTTLTDPFHIMYHEVPLSPWLNTERSTDQTLLWAPPTSPWPWPCLGPCCPASCPLSDLHTVPALLCGSKSRTAANSRFTCEVGRGGSVQ